MSAARVRIRLPEAVLLHIQLARESVWELEQAGDAVDSGSASLFRDALHHLVEGAEASSLEAERDHSAIACEHLGFIAVETLQAAAEAHIDAIQELERHRLRRSLRHKPSTRSEVVDAVRTAKKRIEDGRALKGRGTLAAYEAARDHMHEAFQVARSMHLRLADPPRRLGALQEAAVAIGLPVVGGIVGYLIARLLGLL